jgi:hypothetical protein
MTDDRPPIPGEIKRAVRQRCAFGCVVCGLPLYEYDHMVPYSEVQEHHAGNIVLLCDRHHAEKTKGLLPVQAVIEASTNPANARTGESVPYTLHYAKDACKADVGSNVYFWPRLDEGLMTAPVIVDDTPLVMFRMQDGHLLLTVQLFDDDNEMLVQILDNELIYSIDPWDIEFQGLRLTVRAKARKIFVRMTFEPPSRVLIDRGHIWRNGVEMELSPHEMTVAARIHLSGNYGENCVLGLALGDHPPLPAMYSFNGFARADYTGNASTEARVLRITRRVTPGG